MGAVCSVKFSKFAMYSSAMNGNRSDKLVDWNNVYYRVRRINFPVLTFFSSSNVD